MVKTPDTPETLPPRVSGTMSSPRWCMKESAGRIFLSWPADHRIRADAGMPCAVIRLSTLHPIFASVR